MIKNNSHPHHSSWLRATSLSMAVVFFYIQVAYGVIEPVAQSRREKQYAKLWEERRAAANRLQQTSLEEEGENKNQEETLIAKVQAPQVENSLASQIPSLNLNLLPNSIPKTTIGQTNLKLPSQVQSRLETLPSWFKSLSIHYARLTDLYLPSGWKPGDFMVVHIQDVHENQEAQKNIAKIIESLERSFSPRATGRLIVGLEGASGPFNFSLYRLFPNKQIVKEVANYLLKESFISGPEYVGMTYGLKKESKSDKPSSQDRDGEVKEQGDNSSSSIKEEMIQPFLFWGVEDEDLYLKHIKAFKNSVPLEKKGKQTLKKLEKEIEQLKENIFNQELKKLDKAISQYNREEIKLNLFLKILTQKWNPQKASMIQRYMEALSLEESLNFDKVERERRALTNELVEKLSKQEMNELVSASLAYRVGNISYGAFYQYLKDLCQAYKVKLSDYPQMDNYIRYVLMSDKIKSEELFEEISQLEKEKIESFIQNPKEKELVQKAQDLELLNKLVHFQLSPEEWAEYQKRKKNISELVSLDIQSLQPFEEFNQAGIARNQALVNNLLKKVGIKGTNSANEVAVLVSGGFHTSGMTEILKSKQIAYCVLAPKLGVVEGSGTEYLEIFRRDKTPLEKLFTGERIHLKSPLGTSTPIGKETQEWSPIFSVLERISESLLIVKLVLELGREVTNIDEDMEDNISKQKSGWVEKVKSADGFKTTQDILFKILQEARNKEGVIQKLVVSVKLFGLKNHKNSLLTYDIAHRDSKVSPGIGEDSGPVYKTVELGNHTFNIYKGKEEFLPKAANILYRHGKIFKTKIYSVIGASTLESAVFLTLPHLLITHLLHLSLFSYAGIFIFLIAAIPIFAAFHYEGSLKDIGLRLIPATLFAVGYLVGAALGGDVVAWLSASILHGAFNWAYLNGWIPESLSKYLGLATIGVKVTEDKWQSYKVLEIDRTIFENIKNTLRIIQPNNILFQLTFTPKEFSVVFGAGLEKAYGLVWVFLLEVGGSFLNFFLMPILSFLSPKLTENQKTLYAMKIRWILASAAIGLFTGAGIVTFALSIGLSLPNLLVNEMVFNPTYLGTIIGILIGLGTYLNFDHKALEITIENNYRLYKLMVQRKFDPSKVSDDEINLLNNIFHLSMIAEDHLTKLHSLLLEDLLSSPDRGLIENIYGDFILNDKSRGLFNLLWNELKNQLKKEEMNQEVLITMIRLLTAHWKLYDDIKELDQLREITSQTYRRFGTQNFVEEIMNPLLKKLNAINAHQKTIEPLQEWYLIKIKARKEEVMKQIETQINILSSTAYEALSSKELEKNKDGWNILNNLIEVIKNEDWDINAAAENISNLTPFIEMGTEPVISYLLSKLEPELTEHERQILMKIFVGNPTDEEIIAILRNKEVKIKERTAYLILLRHHKDPNRKALLDNIISSKEFRGKIRIYAFTWYSSQYFHAENENKFEEMIELLADEAKNLIGDAIASDDDAKIEQLFNDIYLQDEEAKVLVMATLLVLQKEAGSFSSSENFLKTAKRISNARVRAYWGNATSGFTLGGGLLEGREKKTALFFQIVAHELGHRILWDQHNYSSNNLKAGIIHEFISDIHTFLFTNVFKGLGLDAQNFMKIFNYNFHYNTVESAIYYSNEVHEGGRAQLAAIQKQVAEINWEVFLSVCFEVLKSEKNRGKELEEIVKLVLNEYFKKGIKVTQVEASKKSAGFTRYALRSGGIRIFSSDRIQDLIQKFSTIPASILDKWLREIEFDKKHPILYKLYTIFGVIWEVVYQILGVNMLAQTFLVKKGIAGEVKHAGKWTLVGITIFSFAVTGGIIASNLGMSAVIPAIAAVVAWSLASAYVFSGAHKGRTPLQKAVLFGVGFILAGVLVAPAIFVLMGMPIPIIGDFSFPWIGGISNLGDGMAGGIGTISNLGKALMFGLIANMVLHSSWNAFVTLIVHNLGRLFEQFGFIALGKFLQKAPAADISADADKDEDKRSFQIPGSRPFGQGYTLSKNVPQSEEKYQIAKARNERILDYYHESLGIIDDKSDEMRQTYQEVKEMTDLILQAAGLNPNYFIVHLVETEQVNAFILSHSNHIFINVGLLKYLINKGGAKDALAFVIAHEITHILQNREDVDDGKANLAKTIKDIPETYVERYTDEYDADWRAIKLLDKVYEQSNGKIGFALSEAQFLFKRISEDLEKESKDPTLNFLKKLSQRFGTHPQIKERIRRLENLLNNFYWRSFFKEPTPFSDGARNEILQGSQNLNFREAVKNMNTLDDFKFLLNNKVKSIEDLEYLLIYAYEKSKTSADLPFKDAYLLADLKADQWVAKDRSLLPYYVFIFTSIQRFTGYSSIVYDDQKEQLKNTIRNLNFEQLHKLLKIKLPAIVECNTSSEYFNYKYWFYGLSRGSQYSLHDNFVEIWIDSVMEEIEDRIEKENIPIQMILEMAAALESHRQRIKQVKPKLQEDVKDGLDPVNKTLFHVYNNDFAWYLWLHLKSNPKNREIYLPQLISQLKQLSFGSKGLKGYLVRQEKLLLNDSIRATRYQEMLQGLIKLAQTGEIDKSAIVDLIKDARYNYHQDKLSEYIQIEIESYPNGKLSNFSGDLMDDLKVFAALFREPGDFYENLMVSVLEHLIAHYQLTEVEKFKFFEEAVQFFEQELKKSDHKLKTSIFFSTPLDRFLKTTILKAPQTEELTKFMNQRMALLEKEMGIKNLTQASFPMQKLIYLFSIGSGENPWILRHVLLKRDSDNAKTLFAKLKKWGRGDSFDPYLYPYTAQTSERYLPPFTDQYKEFEGLDHPEKFSKEDFEALYLALKALPEYAEKKGGLKFPSMEEMRSLRVVQIGGMDSWDETISGIGIESFMRNLGVDTNNIGMRPMMFDPGEYESVVSYYKAFVGELFQVLEWEKIDNGGYRDLRRVAWKQRKYHKAPARPLSLARQFFNDGPVDEMFEKAFGFVRQIPGSYEERLNELAEELPPSIFRNFALYALLLENIKDVLPRGTRQLDMKKVMEPNYLQKIIRDNIILEEQKNLLSLAEKIQKHLIWDKKLKEANEESMRYMAGDVVSGQFLATADRRKAEKSQDVLLDPDQYDPNLREPVYVYIPKGFDSSQFTPFQFHVAGGEEAYVEFLIANIFSQSLGSLFKDPSLTFSKKLEHIMALYPRASPIRDQYLDILLESSSFSPQEIIEVISLFSSEALKQKHALKALELEKDLDPNKFKDFDYELERILYYFPDFSYIRDDLLQHFINTRVQHPKQLEKAQNLLLEFQDNVRKEEARKTIFGHDLLKTIFQNYSFKSNQKMEFLLWFMGFENKKPDFLTILEELYRINFDSLRSAGIQDGKHYKDVGKSAFENALSFFLFGDKGILSDPATSSQFLNSIFDSLIPQGADSNRISLFKDIYLSIFSKASESRKEQILKQLFVQMKKLSGEPSLSSEIREAKAVRAFLESLGFVGIKVGQFLASSNLDLPKHIKLELDSLKTKAPALNKGAAFGALEIAFGNFYDTFQSLDEPLGSASIKMVYKATMKDGRKVVVKIKRPDVEKRIEEELQLLSHVLEAMQTELARKKIQLPENMVKKIHELILQELDFWQEAANQKKLKQNIKNRQAPELSLGFLSMLKRWIPGSGSPSQFTVYVPNSTEVKNNLVMIEELIDGVPVSDEAAIKAMGIDPSKAKEAAAEELLKEIFIDGFFHADPHGGNILVSENRALSFIDVGLMGSLSKQNRETLLQLIIFVQSGSIQNLPFIPKTFGLPNSEDIARLLEKMNQNGRIRISLNKVKGFLAHSQNFTERLLYLLNLVEEAGGTLPDELITFNKALGTAGYLLEHLTPEGIARVLFPQDQQQAPSASIADKKIKEWIERSTKNIKNPILRAVVSAALAVLYVGYTIFGVNWEALYFIPIVGQKLHQSLVKAEIASEVAPIRKTDLLSMKGLVLLGLRIGAIIGFASLFVNLPITILTVPIVVPMVVQWALKSSYVFSGAHKGRTEEEKKILRVVGFTLAAAMFVPAILFMLGIQIPFVGDVGTITSLQAGIIASLKLFGMGILLNFGLHSLYNTIALLTGLPVASITGTLPTPLAAEPKIKTITGFLPPLGSSDQELAKKDVQQLVELIFSGKKSDSPLAAIIHKINQIPGVTFNSNEISLSNITFTPLGNDMNMNKWVFKVSLSPTVHLVLGVTKETTLTGIKEEEIEDFERLWNSGLVPRLIDSGQYGKRDYILLEFIEGPTVAELINQGQFSPEKRKAVIETLLDIAKLTPNQDFLYDENADDTMPMIPLMMPMDINEDNLILNGRAVMIDLGGPKIALGNSIPTLIQYYGYLKGDLGENHFIFQTFLERLGVEHGLALLKENLTYMKRTKMVYEMILGSDFNSSNVEQIKEELIVLSVAINDLNRFLQTQSESKPKDAIASLAQELAKMALEGELERTELIVMSLLNRLEKEKVGSLTYDGIVNALRIILSQKPDLNHTLPLDILNRILALEQLNETPESLSPQLETAGATARWIVPLVLPIWQKLFSQNLLNNRLFVSTVIPILELWGLPGFSLALAPVLGIWISVPVGAFLFALLHEIYQDKDTTPEESRAPPLIKETETEPKAPALETSKSHIFIVRFVATMVISSAAILLSSFLTPYLLPHALPFIQNMVQPFGLEISSKIVQDLLTYLLAGGLHGVFNWFAPQQYRLSIAQIPPSTKVTIKQRLGVTKILTPLVTPDTQMTPDLPAALPPTQITPQNKISILPSPPERQIAAVKKAQGSKITSFKKAQEKRDGASSSAAAPTGKSAVTSAGADKPAVTSVTPSAKIREWIHPVNWIPNIRTLLISAVIAVQSLNPANSLDRKTGTGLAGWNNPITRQIGIWLNLAGFRERKLNLQIQQQEQEVAENEFNQKIKEQELGIANQEMTRIAPSILEDIASLNKTSLQEASQTHSAQQSPLVARALANELKDKLTDLMTNRMNQSLNKKEYANLKQARTNSMEEARSLLLEDYDRLLNLEQVRDDPAKQRESAVLVMTIFHFLILQDEADLELPFVPHSIKHSLNVRKEVGNIISASRTIQANLEDSYGESGIPLAFFSAWLHDIGYGILTKAIDEADKTASQIKDQGDKIAEGYKSEKGYHTVLGVTLAEIPLDGKEGGPTLVNQLDFILGLRDLDGNALGSASAMQDLLIVVKDHGSDKEEVTKDGLRGTGKHKLRNASNKQDILNFLVRMADNLDSVAYSRLYKYQTNPFFIEYLRRMEEAYLKDGKKVGESLIKVRAQLIQEMEITKKVYAHRLQVVEGFTQEQAESQSNNEFDLMEVYVREHNGKDYPHFAGMLFSQSVKEKRWMLGMFKKLVVQAVLNDSNRNIPQKLHKFQLERMETAYQSLRFNHRKIGIEYVNASEKEAESRVGVDTREDTDLNKRKREQIEQLSLLVPPQVSDKKLNIIEKLAQKMFMFLLGMIKNVFPTKFLPDTSGQRGEQAREERETQEGAQLEEGLRDHLNQEKLSQYQINMIQALIHYLKTNPNGSFVEVTKSKGEEIISIKEDQSHDVYILLQGSLEILEGKGDRKPSSLTLGSMIGDSSHLTSKRTEDVLAGSEGARLYRLSGQQVQNLFADPQFMVAYAGLIHARAPPPPELSIETAEPSKDKKKSNIVSIGSFKTEKAKREQRERERQEAKQSRALVVKLTQTFSEFLSELIRNLVYRQKKGVGDPLTSLEQGKKRRIEQLGKLKGESGRRSFGFAIGDIDNISKMNDFFGKDLIGGLTKSDSNNVVFDHQDETLFRKVRHAINKAFKNQVHAYVGGDEFIPEWDDWTIVLETENKYLKYLETWINHIIHWFRKYILLKPSTRDLGDAVKRFKNELDDRYVVFKIKTEKELSDDEVEALQALKGARMMIRHEDGYNLLVERGKIWRFTKRSREKKINELNNAMTQQIIEIFPELGNIKGAVRSYKVEFRMSVGAGNADQELKYLAEKLHEDYWNLLQIEGLKDQWIDPTTDSIRPERLEESYSWGIRFANDLLKIAKENGKDQAYVLGINEKFMDEEQVKKAKEQMIEDSEKEATELASQGNYKEAEKVREEAEIQANQIKANISKALTRKKVWDERKKLEAEKSGLIPQGIDALTGAHTEQGLRERLSKPGNKKENVYLVKMSDYGLNAAMASVRAAHNMNTVLDYEQMNEVIQMVYKELQAALKRQGITISQPEQGAISARAPPDSFFVVLDREIIVGEDFETMLENLKTELDKKFKENLKTYAKNAKKQYEADLEILENELKELKVKGKSTKQDQKQIAELKKEIAKLTTQISALDHLLKNHFSPAITVFHISNKDIISLKKSGVQVSSRFQIISMMDTIDSVQSKMSKEDQEKLEKVYHRYGNSEKKAINFKPENWHEFMKLYRTAQKIKSQEAKLVLFPKKPAAKRKETGKDSESIKDQKQKREMTKDRVAMTLPETRAAASEIGLSPYSWSTEILFAPMYEFFDSFNPFKFYQDHKTMGWRAGVLAVGIGLVWLSMIGFIVLTGYLMPDIKYLIYIVGTISLISGVHLSQVKEIESKIFNLNRWNELSLLDKSALLLVLPMLIPNTVVHSLSNLLFRITSYLSLVIDRGFVRFGIVKSFVGFIRDTREPLIEQNVKSLIHELETKKKQGVSFPKNLIPEIIRGGLLNKVADYKSLERLQVSDQYQNLVQSLKIMQIAALFKGEEPLTVPALSDLSNLDELGDLNNLGERSYLDDERIALLRILRYSSEQEVSQLIHSLERLSRLDQNKMRESFGVWSEKVIESLAQNSLYRDLAITPEQGISALTKDQMVMAYEGFAAIVAPQSKVSQLQRDMVRKLWQSAQTKSKQRLISLKSNMKEVNSLNTIQELENHRVTAAIDVSNPNPSQDQIELNAQQIVKAWSGKTENIKGVLVPLITNQDSLNPETIERVKRTLEDQGHLEVAQQLNKNIHFVVGTRTDLISLIKQKGKPEIDPSIEMDPDDVNEILINKIKERVGSTDPLKELSLTLFTDNMNRYKNKWESKIQIYMILSHLQVVEISKEITDTLHAREVLALQQ